MLVIPSVDIRGGKCVRLSQGRPDRETVYGDDPVAMALRWAREGAELLHVVDLDGAFEGRLVNSGIVRRIVEAAGVPVQLGGGLRDQESVGQAFAMGVSRVILGTTAVREPEAVRQLCEEFPGRIVVSIDARRGKATTAGWLESSNVDAVELARQMADCGVRAIVFTDIATDGMLVGPNFEALRRIAQAVSVPVIASGGVGSLTHIARLARLGIEGTIIGRALYTGDVQLAEAIAVARRVATGGE